MKTVELTDDELSVVIGALTVVIGALTVTADEGDARFSELIGKLVRAANGLGNLRDGKETSYPLLYLSRLSGIDYGTVLNEHVCMVASDE